VEQRVDALLYVIDLGLRLGRLRGHEPDCADADDQSQSREGGAQSLPSVTHEAEVSLLVSYAYRVS